MLTTHQTYRENTDSVISRQNLAVAVLVFIVAFLVRFIVVLQLRDTSPFFYNPVIDAMNYDRLAREFLQNGVISDSKTFLQPIAYPVFLATIYKIFGPSLFTARIIQAAIGACTCALTCLAGNMICRTKHVGLTAGLICACYGPIIYFETDLMALVLTLFLSQLGFLLLILSLNIKKRIPLFLAASCFGMAYIVWPLAGIFSAAAVLNILWLRSFESRKIPALLIIFIFGWLAVFLPVKLYNMSKGIKSHVSSNGGINFYLGNRPGWQKDPFIRPGYEWEKIVTLPNSIYGNESVNTEGSSILFFRHTINQISKKPWEFFKGEAAKIFQLVNGMEIPNPTDLYFFKQYSPLLNMTIYNGRWLKFPFGLLLPLTVVGIISAYCGKQKNFLLPLIFLVVGSLGVLLFFVTARYRLILIPFMALFAAHGINETITAIRSKSKHYRTIATSLLAGTVTFLCVNTTAQLAPHLFSSRKTESQNYFTVGRVMLNQGRYTDSLPWLIRAVRTDPTYTDALIDLGRAHYEIGDENGAVAAMQDAHRLAPDYPIPLYNLGLIHDRSGQRSLIAQNYYKQFLKAAEKYGEAALHGTERINYARERLVVLSGLRQQKPDPSLMW